MSKNDKNTYKRGSSKDGHGGQDRWIVEAEQLEWIAIQLNSLLSAPILNEYPKLNAYICESYMIAYRSAAEIYELEDGKHPLKLSIY